MDARYQMPTYQEITRIDPNFIHGLHREEFWEQVHAYGCGPLRPDAPRWLVMQAPSKEFGISDLCTLDELAVLEETGVYDHPGWWRLQNILRRQIGTREDEDYAIEGSPPLKDTKGLRSGEITAVKKSAGRKLKVLLAKRKR